MKTKVRVFKAVFLAALLLISSLSFTSVSAADSGTSRYLQLGSDVLVTGTQEVLSVTINFTQTTKVYVQSDGRIFPSGGAAVAYLTVTLDGGDIGSAAVLSWAGSTNMQQHCYNTIGAVTVSPGLHTFALKAVTLNGQPFMVGSTSNLCVMANPAANVLVASLPSDSQLFNFTTGNIYEGTPVPHIPILTLNVNNASGPIIALGSARAHGNNGDAMFGIYRNGNSLPNNEGMWTVNDLYSGAEMQAPYYTHAFMNTTGSHTISLDATEFPWSPDEDTVTYQAGSGSKLVCLYGGMQVAGSAPISYKQDSRWDWINLGTYQNFELASATIYIPAGHNGTVMFMTKSRIQCDSADQGGTVKLWINIDGVDRGSVGIQQLAYPNCVSQRTMTASYLATGAEALSPGYHTVKVYGRADGTFKHPCMVGDLPLLWFD